MKGKAAAKSGSPVPSNYGHLVNGIASVIDAGRQQAAWSLNAIMSAVYWDIGRQIVLFEQGGKARAEHGTRLVNLLAKDLTVRFGRGFRQSNLYHIRAFYLAYAGRFQTVSGILPASGQGSERFQTVSGKLDKPKGGRYPAVQVGLKSEQLAALTRAFPLPWSHYSRLLTVDNPHARDFTRLKRCAVDGRGASLTAKFHLSSTSVPRFPETKRPCFAKEPSRIRMR